MGKGRNEMVGTELLKGQGLGNQLFCYVTTRCIAMKDVYKRQVLHSPLVKKELFRIKGKLLGARDPSDIYVQSRLTDPLTMDIAREHGNLPYKYTQMPAGYLEETNHTIMLMDMLMYHPDDILVKVDRTAMAVSLETRVDVYKRQI